MNTAASLKKGWLQNAWFVFVVALTLHVAVIFVLQHYNNPRLWENGAMATGLFEGKGLSRIYSKHHDQD
jgi:hypothetical protein